MTKMHASQCGFAFLAAATVALTLLTGCSTTASASKPTACTIKQASVLLFNKNGSTVRSADAFQIPDILKISATPICSGVFSNAVDEPSGATNSLAVFDGGKTVFPELIAQLKNAGFSGPQHSGQSTEGWTKGEVQVYAVKLMDNFSDAAPEFKRPKDLVLVVVRPRRQ